MIRFSILFVFLSLFMVPKAVGQNNDSIVLSLTLEDAINLANQQSLLSFRYKNMYLARYWEFRSFKADRLPSLGLSASPFSFNKSYQRLWNSEKRVYEIVPYEGISSSATLALQQKIPFTGGVLSLESKLNRDENLGENDPLSVTFNSTVVSIGLQQPISRYNELKWESRIAPKKFEQAKMEYLQSRENVADQCISHFFSVANAEINKSIAEVNYANADTLYRIGKGRFEIGTVTQDELLDLELSLLNARLDLSRSEVELRQSNASLNSFLGIDEEVKINCIIPYDIPKLQIDVRKALSLAMENNPQILGFDQELLEAARTVAQTRANNGITANVNGNFGIAQRANDFEGVYLGPFAQSSRVEVGLSVPIMDWGVRKGRIEMARSNQEVTQAKVKQDLIDFEQEAINNLLDFNLQGEQVAISAKADTIAQLGFDVTKQRFMIGKVDVIRLNAARNSLDPAAITLRRYVGIGPVFMVYVS